jgi:hypothetical protein
MKVILTVATAALLMVSTSFAQCSEKGKKCCGKKDAKSEAVQECSKKKCCDKKDAKDTAVNGCCDKSCKDKKDKGDSKGDK